MTEGHILPITRWNEPVMHQVTQPVTDFGEELQQLVADMFATMATCTGLDEHGQPVTVEGSGLFARCLQHETDHLNGIVFGDRLSPRSRRKLDEQHEELSPLYPDDWPISPKLKRHEV